MIVSPGFIDLHVHLRDPGRIIRDHQTGTKSARGRLYRCLLHAEYKTGARQRIDTVSSSTRHARLGDSRGPIAPPASEVRRSNREIAAMKRGIVAVSDDGSQSQRPSHAASDGLLSIARSPVIDIRRRFAGAAL